MFGEHGVQRVQVSFVGVPSAEQVARASGVSEVEIDGSVMRCLVRGSFQPFLEALRGYEVTSLQSVPAKGVTALSSDKYAPKVAGFAYLLLIVFGMVSIALTSGVRTSHGIADTLRSISEHSGAVRFTIVLAAASGLTTLVLAAMLYAIVVRADRNLAILALSCRVLEGGFYGLNILATLVLLWLAQRNAQPATGELADLVTTLKPLSNNIGAIFFALGSTVFCHLLVKARAIPVVLSTTGVIASVLVLVGVPIQTALSRNTFDGASALIWVPIAVFEISAALWLIVKGARMIPVQRTELEPVPV